ncbi:MAG: helix-turn-helix domain-containing protein [bacterium]|nr:helix-turn-helix domain-containing protein [bacterium]
MNKQITSSQLQSFGLDEIEIKIYLYLLENGAKTPLDLSRETSINRSMIYRYLGKLKDKKLVEESNIGRGLKLKASDPANLQLLIHEQEYQLQKQKDLLPQVIKDLSVLPSHLQNEFEIKQYHGSEGLKQMLWNQLSANKEIFLYGYQTRNEIVGASFADKVREEQIRRKITLYEIEEEVDPGNFTGSFTYTKVRNWKKYYVPRYIDPKVLKIRQYTSIFNDTVSVMNWENGQKVGVEIINSLYASMQKQLFWLIWEKIAVKPKRPTLKK